MMKHRIIAGVVLAIICTACPTIHAGMIDFEDILLGASANVGGSMTSGGVTIQMQDYIWSAGTIYAGGHADIILPWSGSASSFGSGQVFYPNNINALFDFAGTVGQQSQVVIPYYEGGGNVNLHVNPAMGGAIVNTQNFTDAAINGAVVNGVSISVAGTIQNGTITLTGAIDAVLIGGQEALFDHIQYVPEPGSVLLCAAGLAWFTARRHRK